MTVQVHRRMSLLAYCTRLRYDVQVNKQAVMWGVLRFAFCLETSADVSCTKIVDILQGPCASQPIAAALVLYAA